MTNKETEQEEIEADKIWEAIAKKRSKVGGKKYTHEEAWSTVNTED